jgi:XTP/dITP diphosphohydrolase
MTPELLVATRNKKKLGEIKELLKSLPLKITSLEDYHSLPKIEEDGLNFEQNAIKKAVTIALYTKKLTLGEDSGLEVAALNNQPGVYSSRFSGPQATDKKNNLKLLRLLRGLPLKKRKARYRSCVALADGKKLIYVGSGSCSGLIGFRSKGNFGFGYDPLFIPAGFARPFGQLDPAIKKKMSHRARALSKLLPVIARYLRKRTP